MTDTNLRKQNQNEGVQDVDTPHVLLRVAEKMHATCATYDVALPRIDNQHVRGQLQNFADESHQQLSLLQQHLTPQAATSSLSNAQRAASLAAVQASAWLQAKQVQLGHLLGTQDLFAALADCEQALVQTLAPLCAQGQLAAPVARLAQDQLNCARERQRWLADPQNAAAAGQAAGKARAQAARQTPAGAPLRNDGQINTTRPASSDNSDC